MRWQTSISPFFFLLFCCWNGSVLYAQSAATPAQWLSTGDQQVLDRDFAAAKVSYQQAYTGFVAMENWQGAAQSLNHWADAYMSSMQMDSALLLFEKTIALAAERNLPAEAGFAYQMFAQIQHIRGNNPEALHHSLQCVNQYAQTDDRLAYGSCLMYAGRQYDKMSRPDSAEWYLLAARDVFLELEADTELSITYNLLGLAYSHRSENGKATDALLKALAYAKKNPERGHNVTILLNLAKQMINQGLYAKAKPYAEQGKAIADSAKMTIYQAGALIYLGQISEKMSSLAEAEQHYRTAAELYAKTRIKPREIGALTNLISVLLQQNRTEAAENALARLTELVQSAGATRDVVLLNLQKAELLLQQQRYPQVQPLLLKTHDMALAGDMVNYAQQALAQLARSYTYTGDYEAAYRYQQESQILRDTVMARQQSEFVQELEARYNRTQQDREIETLNYTTAIQDLELKAARRQGWMLGGGVLLALGLAGMGFYLFFDKRKTSARLTAQNAIIEKALAEKDLLLREIHHRVKNNLQVISSLLSLQSRYIDDPQAVQAINEGRTRVRSMALIHQNLYQGENLTDVPVKDYFDRLLSELFETYRVDENRIELKKDITPLEIDVDTVVPIGLILNELVSNALKYAFPDQKAGQIEVKLYQQQHSLVLEVSDDGIGIKRDDPFANPTSFGHRLIKALATKLEAKLRLMQQATGTSVRLEINN